MARKVMIFGTFDGIHEGHRSLFKQARAYGEHLMVVVARDATVMVVKGQMPRNDERRRVADVAREECVVDAALGNADDKHEVIRIHRPDVICLGYDQNNFIDTLEKTLQDVGLHDTKIIRLKAYKPKVYKSSKIF